jgi:hypothetical protein
MGNRPRDIRHDEDRLHADDATHAEIIKVIGLRSPPEQPSDDGA